MSVTVGLESGPAETLIKQSAIFPDCCFVNCFSLSSGHYVCFAFDIVLDRH